MPTGFRRAFFMPNHGKVLVAVFTMGEQAGLAVVPATVTVNEHTSTMTQDLCTAGHVLEPLLGNSQNDAICMSGAFFPSLPPPCPCPAEPTTCPCLSSRPTWNIAVVCWCACMCVLFFCAVRGSGYGGTVTLGAPGLGVSSCVFYSFCLFISTYNKMFSFASTHA